MEFGTAAAADVLNLSPRRVRSLVRAGVVTPRRGPRGAFRFGFRDLVLLRVASSLLDAGISSRRVLRSLSRLRARLPADRSLSELRIVADGATVLVYEGDSPYEAHSGQFVLDFRVSDLVAKVAPLPRPRRSGASSAEWYRHALALEDRDRAGARAAYERALAIEPDHADALVNLGRLLHEDGDADGAAVLYERALDAEPGHATAAFNLGVALEDRRDWRGAADAYERAIGLQPSLADAHFNLSAVRERLGDRHAALRSLRRYRELTGAPAAR